MANVSTTYGLVPYKSLAGEIRAVECVALSSYGTDLFIGDPVILGGSGDQSGRLSIQQAVGSEGTESTNIFGVIAGFNPTTPESLNTIYGAASTTRIVTVIPALPTTIFRIKASNTTGPNPDDLGLHFDLVSGSGSTLTGKSGFALDVGEDNNAGATTGRQVALIGFDDRPDNAIGAAGTDTPYIDCLVHFVESHWISGAGV